MNNLEAWRLISESKIQENKDWNSISIGTSVSNFRDSESKIQENKDWNKKG